MLAKYLILCFLALGALAQDHVLELNDQDFTGKLAEIDRALVMFYAPWCGHCKKLKPEFEKAAKLLLDIEYPVTLAKVDCTEGGKDTCQAHSVTGYPTLKIFSKGQVTGDYNGGREADDIYKHMKALAGPASKELKTKEDLKKCLTDKYMYIIGYFEDENSKLAESFKSVANVLREKVQFAHTSVKALLESQKLKNTIVLYRPEMFKSNFEDSKVIYEGDDSTKAITEFINKNFHGLCDLRTHENAASFVNPLVVAYYDVDYDLNPKGTNYWRNRVMKVIKSFPSYKCAVSNKDKFQHELNEIGIEFSKSEKPVVIARDADGKKYVMKDEFSVDTFKKFMDDLTNDKLEPHIKSEPVPEDNSGPVKVAVAKNFDEIVTNNDKDVLIEFYAPWCGHCKKLAPIFDELGEKLANEEVTIAKFDATANDVPSGFEVKGFPTLYWVPKNSKKPEQYQGGREIDDFVKYIAKKSTDGLKGFDQSGKPVKAPSDEL